MLIVKKGSSMQPPLATSASAVGGWFLVALFGAAAGAAGPAWAGVGLGVVLDLPPVVKVGDSSLAGSLTLTSFNTDRDQQGSNIVFGIVLTPSCRIQSPASGCPGGAEDPEVLTIDSPASGRAGTACGGTVFTVAVSDPMTGEVTFDSPDGLVALGPVTGPVSARQCIIDFTFSVTALPGSGAETTAYAGAWAISAPGLRPGSGGNLTALRVE